MFFFFFSSRRRHTRFDCDWSSDVCSSDLPVLNDGVDYLVAYALSHGLDLLVTGGSRGNLALCYKGPHMRRLTSRIMAGAYLKAPFPDGGPRHSVQVCERPTSQRVNRAISRRPQRAQKR